MESQSTLLQCQNSAPWGKMFLLDREWFRSFPPSRKELKRTVETSSMNWHHWPGCSTCTAATLPRPCTALLPLSVQLVMEEQMKLKIEIENKFFQAARTTIYTPRVFQLWPYCRWKADWNSKRNKMEKKLWQVWPALTWRQKHLIINVDIC